MAVEREYEIPVVLSPHEHQEIALAPENELEIEGSSGLERIKTTFKIEGIELIEESEIMEESGSGSFEITDSDSSLYGYTSPLQDRGPRPDVTTSKGIKCDPSLYFCQVYKTVKDILMIKFN